MKKILAICITLTLIPVSFSPFISGSNQNGNQEFLYTENPNDDFSITYQSNDEGISISLKVDDFIKTPYQIDNELYYSISVGEESQILKNGYPDLPNICRSFIIPNGKKMKLNIVETSFQTINEINIAPSKGNIIRTNSPENTPFEFADIYNENIWYPNNVVELRNPYIFRDFRGQVVCFQPFQYNPAQHTLKIYTSIKIDFVPDGPGEINVLNDQPNNKHIPTSFFRIYGNHFFNFNDLQYSPVFEEGNMLIVSYDDFYDDMQSFVNWKNMKGIPTEVVNVSETGGTATDIESYIENYYNANGLTFVLLVGDIDQIPTLTASGHASDPSYGYITGSDSYPEVFIGRFSAQNSDQLSTMINRTLTYEKTPDITLDWYHKGVGIGSNGGPGDDNEYDWEHMRNIRNDLLDFTYSLVDELYDGSHGGKDEDGNPSSYDVAMSLNDGRSIVNYVGHGSPSGWSTTGFSSSDVHNLANDNMLPYVICVACNNGQFDDYDECFCEAWLRATHNGKPTGAIAATGSSKGMNWSPPMDAQDEMVDLLTEQYPENIMYTIGGIHANGCMHMNDEYGSSGYAETDTWHIFGDPSLVVRTDTPANMTVSHASSLISGSTTFEVTVTNIEHAFCAISSNGMLLGYNYTDAAGECVIEFDQPIADIETVDLVVTAFNKNPYIATLDVLPQVWQPAEFEPMEAVLIRYPFGITYDLIAEMAEDVNVITIVVSESEKNTVENLYQSNGVNVDHTSYLIAPSDSYWTRDYGPWFIFNRTNDDLEVIDFEYNRPRPNDNYIPYEFALNQSLNYTYMDLEHTGGNYMTDGQGISVSTQLVWDENPGKTHEAINQTMYNYFGIHTYHVRPDVNNEYIKHIDCWAKYLSPDTIMIREVPASHPQYDEIEDAVDYFKTQLSCYETLYNVVRVYTPNDEPYTNSLILNDKVLVPETGDQWDDDAIASYQSAMPGYEVLGFTALSSHPWESTDALHCRTKGIPDRHMLYIDHTPLTYVLPSDDGFYVEAQVISYSGTNLLSSSPTVVWKNSTDVWNNLTMNLVEENTYGASIPPHSCGETIDYYINAQDASGRNTNHPYIGADGPHNFTVTLVPDIWVDPLSFDLSNSANVTITDLLTIGNYRFAGEELIFTIACTDNEEYGWLSVNITGGSLLPNETMNIMVKANTSYLPKGDHSEFIIINSNDPDEQVVYIPVNLTVVLAHDIGTVSVNNPSGTKPHGNYSVNATIQNFGSQDQTNVVINCTIMKGIIGTFLYETFSGAFPPNGWSQEEPGEWDQHNGNDAGGTAPEAHLYWSNINGDYACLNSKPVNTIGAPTLTLSFNHSIDHYTDSFNCRVFSRADSSGSWTDVTPWENPITNDINPEERKVDISFDIGIGTQVRYEFQGNDYNLNDWYVDDVHIYAPDTRNCGDIVYTTENIVDIDAMIQKDITFSPEWQADTNGFYAIQVTTQLAGDQENSNDVSIGTVEIFEDTNPPVISNIHDYPDPQIVDDYVTISCSVTDEVSISHVNVNITGPAGFTPVNVSMIPSGNDGYYYNENYSIKGNYTYFIWANDTSGNSVKSSMNKFRIVNDSYLSIDILLNTGWNLITVPVNNGWYASTLAENITNCSMVSWFDAEFQILRTHIVGVPAYDFPIQDGFGYFILVDQNSTFSVSGLPLHNVSVQLYEGWNMIGWYNQYNTTASTLAENITNCSMVSWFDAEFQILRTHIVGVPGYDFDIDCGMGLFILVNEASIWDGE